MLSTITNIFLVLPGLPLLIVIVAYVQNKSVTTIIIVLTITGWAWGARVLRSQAISLRDRPFMEAARMSGRRPLAHRVFHVVPNMFGVLAANFFGAAALRRACLIGLAVPRPGQYQPTDLGIDALRGAKRHGLPAPAWLWLLLPVSASCCWDRVRPAQLRRRRGGRPPFAEERPRQVLRDRPRTGRPS